MIGKIACRGPFPQDRTGAKAEGSTKWLTIFQNASKNMKRDGQTVG